MTPQSYERPRRQPQPLNETVARQQADPCLRILGELAAQLQEFGEPEGMHRVGVIEGVRTRDGYARFQDEIAALLPGLGQGHVSLEEESDRNYEIARALLFQMLESAPAGAVKLDIYDPQFTGAFREFSALPPANVNLVTPGAVKGVVEDYSRHVTQVHNSETPVGTTANPYRILVLAGEGRDLDPQARQQLDQLMASGATWGSVLAVGVHDLEDNPWLRKGWPQGFDVVADTPMAGEIIEQKVNDISVASRNIEPLPLDQMLPRGEIWTRSARDGIDIVLGGLDGRPYSVSIGDEFMNFLLTGRAGSGKTITLRGAILSIAENYSPDEVEIRLLDYKEGAEFSGFVPDARDPSYIPNIRVLGSNINNDPEFGIEALRSLGREMERRGALGRAAGSGRYSEIRDAYPDERLPRILMLIDEFQVLLQDKNFGDEAAALLEDIARRGRSLGVHLGLASQNLSGIQALYAKMEAIFRNFPLRIGGQGGDMLNSQNPVCAGLPRLHVAVNTEAGEPGHEKVVRTMAAYGTGIAERQGRLYAHRRPSDPEPRAFDASKLPLLQDAPAWQKLKPKRLAAPSLIVADEYRTEGGSARFALDRKPGRNLAVVGQSLPEVDSIMNTAVRSLVKQLPQETDDAVTLVCLERSHAGAVEALATELSEEGHTVNIVGESRARDFFAKVRADLDPDSDVSQYIFVYGADNDRIAKKPKKDIVVPIPDGTKVKATVGVDVRVGGTLSDFSGTSLTSPAAGKIKEIDNDSRQIIIETEQSSGRQELSELINTGSQAGVHIVATFSTPTRLKDTIGNGSPMVRTDGIGGYVSVGYHDTEMGSFAPGVLPSAKGTNVRPWRARFMDRAQGGGASLRTVIPYDDPAATGPAEDEED